MFKAMLGPVMLIYRRVRSGFDTSDRRCRIHFSRKGAGHCQGGVHLRLPARIQLPYPIFLFRGPRQPRIQGPME